MADVAPLAIAATLTGGGVALEERPRILVLAHSASRNGASILLLHFLRWLKEQTDWQVEVLVDGTGPLLDDLKAIAPTQVWRLPSLPERVPTHGTLTRVHALLQEAHVRHLLGGRTFDLIYANTSAVCTRVQVVERRAPALLWHIHELDYALRRSIGRHPVDATLRRATRVVAVSKSVRDALHLRFGVPADRIDLSYGFAAGPEVRPQERHANRQRLLSQSDWPTDAFVVGACGSLGWRKGSDLFLQIADRMRRTPDGDHLRFLWVGGRSDDRDAAEFTHDLDALGLRARVRWVPDTEDVSAFYDAMDVLALTSREDPFPLVMLEAGAHAVPVVCFDGSGGACEFVAEGAGRSVPYLDIDAFVACLRWLDAERACHERLGAQARDAVHRYYSIAVQGPRLLAAMERCLQRSGQRAADAALSPGGSA